MTVRELDEAALRYECAYCLAQPGRWCRRANRVTGEYTGRASYLHNARTRPVWDAWRVGWTDGVTQVIADLRRWAVEFPDAPNVALLTWAADRVEGSWVARRT